MNQPSLFKRIRRRTIARDLTLGLVFTIAASYSVLGAINYFYSIDRDTESLNAKAHELMTNLAEVLVTPVWNLDNDELRKILTIYRQSDIVISIRLVDESKALLADIENTRENAFLTLSRTISREGKYLGEVTVAFSGAHIVNKQREIAVYSIVTFLVVILAIAFATSYLLSRYLTEPFQKLISGIEVIASGDYSRELASTSQEDINTITRRVNVMAREISKREQAIEDNRAKLEILNQAILDIFSCSDTENLIRTTMLLAHKVCDVDSGWFLARKDARAHVDEEVESAPVPLVSIRGQTFEATEAEVAPHVGRSDGVRTFSFPIKSRHRIVGTVTFAYDEDVDASESSLLKSLMSLAGLAMVRQSFIRESAFITAELQVAETVQRSMLPDASRRHRQAAVAWHFEPVLRVGGDWFNCIESKDGSSIFAILGDVTGHGLAQGLVTTAVSGAMQVVESLIHDLGDVVVDRPSQFVTILNSVITRIAGKSNLRMTCVAVRLDFKRGELTVCNAGHTFPVLLKPRETSEKFTAKSVVRRAQPMLGEATGSSARHRYFDEQFEFGKDDRLLLYTDGLVDATDPAGKSFMRGFMRQINRSDSRSSVEEIKTEIIQNLRKHTAAVPIKDDICLVVIGRRPTKQSSDDPADGRNADKRSSGAA